MECPGCGFSPADSNHIGDCQDLDLWTKSLQVFEPELFDEDGDEDPYWKWFRESGADQ